MAVIFRWGNNTGYYSAHTPFVTALCASNKGLCTILHSFRAEKNANYPMLKGTLVASMWPFSFIQWHSRNTRRNYASLFNTILILPLRWSFGFPDEGFGSFSSQLSKPQISISALPNQPLARFFETPETSCWLANARL